MLSNLPSLLEKNKEFALGEEEIAAENRQQLLNILIRLLADSEVEVTTRFVCLFLFIACFNSEVEV